MKFKKLENLANFIPYGVKNLVYVAGAISIFSGCGDGSFDSKSPLEHNGVVENQIVLISSTKGVYNSNCSEKNTSVEIIAKGGGKGEYLFFSSDGKFLLATRSLQYDQNNVSKLGINERVFKIPKKDYEIICSGCSPGTYSIDIFVESLHSKKRFYLKNVSEVEIFEDYLCDY